MDKGKVEKLIREIAVDCNVDPVLALALSFVESGIDTTKVRYEPQWKYPLSPEKFASRLGISADTERVLQSMSWSCMQIMGANARILGYNGQLTLLVQPQLGVLYACKHIQVIQKKYTNELDLISSYNQGVPAKINGIYKNQGYVQKVLDRLAYLRGR